MPKCNVTWCNSFVNFAYKTQPQLILSSVTQHENYFACTKKRNACYSKFVTVQWHATVGFFRLWCMWFPDCHWRSKRSLYHHCHWNCSQVCLGNTIKLTMHHSEQLVRALLMQERYIFFHKCKQLHATVSNLADHSNTCWIVDRYLLVINIVIWLRYYIYS